MKNYRNLLDRNHKYLRYLLVLSFITFVILFAWAPVAHPAYDYRKLIEIHNSQVSGSSDLDNFPVLVSIQNDSDLQAGVTHANGYDITFRAFDGTTVLDHEVEKWDGATGTLVAWVRLPTVYIGTDTKFYLYYGDSSVSSPTENPSGVWDSNYMGVWHLKEEAGGTGTVDLYQDSTSYNNHGDDYVSATGQDGQLDGGQQFDGTDDYVNCGNNSNLNVNYITIEFWLKVNSWVSDGGILAKGTSSARRYWIWTYGGTVAFEIDEGGNHNGAWNPPSGQWEHLVLTYDGSNVITYRNGGLETNTYPQATGTIDATTEPLLFGDIPPYNHADVNLDEMRISDTARTAGWIGTSYTNQNTPDVFYRVNSENYIGGGNQAPTVDAGPPTLTITLPASADLSDASASDSDGPSSLTYTWTKQSGPGTVTFSPNNTVLNPTASFSVDGTYVLKLSVYDGADTGEDTVTITVNASGGGGVGTPITAGDVAGYSCNMKITIDNTKVAFTSSENFPVLISLTDDSLTTSGCGFVTDPDGDDIIFTNSDLTLQLYHEIEKYDETTGEIVAWVLVPSLSGTSDTDIYMYFGNSSVTSPTESPTDVWDSDYAGVWHLKEDAATVPPTTFERSVAVQSDDAEEDLTDGGIDLSSSDLELIEESNDQEVGMRFTNMTIPPGATITNAYIEFTVDEDDTVATNLTFWGQDADNPGTFTSTANDITNRTKTSTSVAWSSIPSWNTADPPKQSPDIKSIIQEIVDRGGWASGNAMVIIVTGTGKRVAEAYGGTAPLLHVEYGAVADLHLDSTSNDNDGIPNGNTLTASGKIDGAQDFDGNDDYVEIGTTGFSTTNMTFSAWVKADALADRRYIFGHTTQPAFANRIQLYTAGTAPTLLGLGLGDTHSKDTGSALSTGTWYHVALVMNATNYWVYLNSALDMSGTYTGLSTLQTYADIGNEGNPSERTESWNGVIDEVRVSDVARSAEWIQTSYNNQNDPSSFYSVEKSCPSTIPPIAEFTCNIPITIDSSKVSGTSDLTNFPVLISLTNTSLRNTGSCGYVENSSGYDIIFSDATQTTILDHEIEKYDGASGELVAWVRVPTLKYNEDTVINIHYGHSSSVCGATENPTGVWDSNYKGVWHLGDTSGATQDSTSYNTGGSLSGTVTRGATGQIGDAFDFNSDNDEVDWGQPAHLNFGTGEMTLSLWVNIDSNRGQWEQVIRKGKGSWESGYQLEIDSGSNTFHFGINDGSHSEWGVYSNFSFSLDTWTHFVGVVDRSNNLLRAYKDGVQVGTSNISSVGSIDVSDVVTIGRSNWKWPDGRVDEVRLSNTARSADWIQTEYNNQSNPSSFYSVGASSCFLGGFSCNRRITIDSTKVAGSSDLTNFPFLLRIQNDCNLKTAANGGGVQNSSGWDIIFVDSDGVTQLDHEIEEYDGTTGDLTAWVRVPTLPYNSDKEIYLHYGKTGLTCDPSNPAGVWQSGYAGVWHLNETTGSTHYDSTSNDNDGTQNGNSSAGGKISGAQDFDGSQDWIEVPNSSSLDITGDEITLSAWVQMDASQAADAGIINKSYSNNYNYMLNVQSNEVGDFRVKTPSGTTYLDGSTILSVGQWYFLYGIYDGVNAKVYLDGAEDGTDARTGNIESSGAAPVVFGRRRVYPTVDDRFFNGFIDEARISNVARSVAWMTTEYNNQSDPDTFSTMSQDTCGGTYGFNFQYCKKIVVDHTQVSGDLTRYPLLINITGDDDLKTVANGGRIQHSQGWDIVFRTSGCGNLDHEIEKYDGVNGDLVAWVLIDPLSSSSDTEIYMYYGATIICDTSNPTAVWDARFRAVYHLNDDFNDSTQYNRDGTNYGATFTPSKIGNGALFTPSNGWDHIELGTWDMSSDDFTVQAWVWPNDFNQNDPRVVSKCSTSGAGTQYHVYMLSLYNGDNNENRMRFRLKTGSDDLLNTVELRGPSPNGYLPTAQTWYFLASTYENDVNPQIRMYRDEGLDAGTMNHSLGGDLRQNSWPVWIGASPSGSSNSGYSWDGILDEVRILSSDLSQEWLATEYRNHNDPGNFYSITSCFEQTTEVTQEWVEEVQ